MELCIKFVSNLIRLSVRNHHFSGRRLRSQKILLVVKDFFSGDLVIGSCCVGLFCGDPSRCFPVVDPWDNIEFRRENGKRERNKNRKQKQENGEDSSSV